jgi:molybdopterin converting factor small subunit
MAVLRLFGPAREVAGVARVDVPGGSVEEIVHAATDRFGPAFADVVAISRIWVNGEAVAEGWVLSDRDEVAVVPPVSGG